LPPPAGRYANGSHYEGAWQNNLKHGEGRFTFEDGSVYSGPFEHDRLADGSIQPCPDMFGHLKLGDFLSGLTAEATRVTSNRPRCIV
jgi:hypothetical protein